MGRNQEKSSIGHQKQHERHKHRHDNRQTGNLWQHEGRFIFVNRTGPDDPPARCNQAMMAAFMVLPAMEIE